MLTPQRRALLMDLAAWAVGMQYLSLAAAGTGWIARTVPPDAALLAWSLISLAGVWACWVNARTDHMPWALGVALLLLIAYWLIPTVSSRAGAALFTGAASILLTWRFTHLVLAKIEATLAQSARLWEVSAKVQSNPRQLPGLTTMAGTVMVTFVLRERYEFIPVVSVMAGCLCAVAYFAYDGWPEFRPVLLVAESVAHETPWLTRGLAVMTSLAMTICLGVAEPLQTDGILTSRVLTALSPVIGAATAAGMLMVVLLLLARSALLTRDAARALDEADRISELDALNKEREQ